MSLHCHVINSNNNTRQTNQFYVDKQKTITEIAVICNTDDEFPFNSKYGTAYMFLWFFR